MNIDTDIELSPIEIELKGGKPSPYKRKNDRIKRARARAIVQAKAKAQAIAKAKAQAKAQANTVDKSNSENNTNVGDGTKEINMVIDSHTDPAMQQDIHDHIKTTHGLTSNNEKFETTFTKVRDLIYTKEYKIWKSFILINNKQNINYKTKFENICSHNYPCTLIKNRLKEEYTAIKKRKYGAQTENNKAQFKILVKWFKQMELTKKRKNRLYKLII